MSADGKLARAKLEKTLHNGDGLALRGDGTETGLVYAGPDAAKGETAVLRIRPDAKVRTGYAVYRLTDAVQIAAAESLKSRTVAADLTLRAMPGEAMTLTATDGESTVTVTGETAAAAKTRAATEEELVRNLKKTGETVFIPREVKAKTAGAFVPVSQVNAIRREALEALAEERIKAFESGKTGGTDGDGSFVPLCVTSRTVPPVPSTVSDFSQMAYVRTREQAEKAREAGFRIVWRPEDYREEALEALKAGMQPGDWLALPDVCEEDTLRGLRKWVGENRNLLGGVVLGSVGQLGIEWPVVYGAGPAIPVMNRQAAMMLMEEGCAFVTASPELTGSELKQLSQKSEVRSQKCKSTDKIDDSKDLPIVTVVYGRTRLMLLHHCPARTALGLKKGHKDCRMCDEGHADALKGQVLEDRKGYSFPLLRQRLPEGCLVELMNALPTDNIRNSQFNEYELPKAVVFTTENQSEIEDVLTAYATGRKTQGETTSGHWKRPVE